MTIELVYWALLAIGLGYILISLLVGDLLDFIDIDIGDGVSFTGVVFAAMAGLGIGGLLGKQLWSQSDGESIITGILFGAILGLFTLLVFNTLAKAEAGPPFSREQLVGKTGTVTVVTSPVIAGQVGITYDGFTRYLPATSKKMLHRGTEVVVVSVTGDVLFVNEVLTEGGK